MLLPSITPLYRASSSGSRTLWCHPGLLPFSNLGPYRVSFKMPFPPDWLRNSGLFRLGKNRVGSRVGCGKMEYDGGTTAMDFGFSGEIIFIMLLALILFGPRKLPEIARTMGRFMADFRKASTDFQTQIQSEIRQLEIEEADPTKHLAPAVDEVKKMADEEETSISGALNRLSERIKGSIPQDYD